VLLALDVGNSNTTIGVFVGDQLRGEYRVGTRTGWTRDEVAGTLRSVLALAAIDFEDVDAAVLASVVPPVESEIVEALRTYMDVDPLIVGPGVKTGMPVRYDPPKDVGADRIVAAVAAHARYAPDPENGKNAKRPVVVVDFGTATTFDVVSAKPEYLGGAIAPGIGISADALFTRAAKLPRVTLKRPASVVGRNTVHAIQSGLLYGYVALVEGMLARIGSELGAAPFTVATGGLAATVAEATDRIHAFDDSLMLDGLRLIYQRNT
jgi:type III pantothenate kinase